MTCFFSVIVWFAGEVGAMAFGRVASTVYILVGVGGSLGKQRGFGGGRDPAAPVDRSGGLHIP